MIAQNLAYQAIRKGYTASELLNDLAAQDTGSGLLRRLKRYCRPDLLVIDEVGYLASSNRHGDLLFEIVTRRYQEKSILITTNKPFAEWSAVFPSAGCVTTLVDRLTHNADIVKIAGESYRLKESNERKQAKELKLKAARRKPAP
jgi:DNA replication protein DnaC